MHESAKMHEILDGLITKHQNNEYVYGRLVHYIETLLPAALDNATEVNKQREERRSQLSANRDEFTARFLSKNNYFYSPQTELFLHYDGRHFVVRSEDDIQHQILTTISSEKCLREWKHKVNKNIIKRIKERSPLNAIPESVTIQAVINSLCPAIFPTRNQVKYFLTIVGECIAHKTNTDTDTNTVADTVVATVATADAPLIYIFPPALKEIIREIGNQCYTFFGMPNLFTHIKFKYYDHNYQECRLLAIERTSGRKKIEMPIFFTKHMLDFLCVASHYATRYGNADKFLNQCNESRLVEHALFLKRNTPESIVGKFIEKSLSFCAITSTIDFKNMIFLWKKYLDECGIPNIIFHETLKSFLKNKFSYDETKECFMGVTSIHLPVVSHFLKFWEETITEGLANTENEDELDMDELELDEICALFKQWSSIAANKANKHNINELFILDLIQHFYPDLVIVENKYILRLKCKLWNKSADVINAMKLYQGNNNLQSDTEENTSVLYDAYDFYCSLNKNKTNLLVSKPYFEKIAITTILKTLDIQLP
jgi:hypothetical protein